jgi:hypothetical protein
LSLSSSLQTLSVSDLSVRLSSSRQFQTSKKSHR